MKSNIRKSRCLLLFVLLATCMNLHAQELPTSTVNSTGNTFKNGSYTFEWSVGEMTTVHTVTKTNIVLSQGVLQPVDLESGLRKVVEAVVKNNVKVFPVPATDFVNLELTSKEKGSFYFDFIDLKGTVLIRREVYHDGVYTRERVPVDKLSNGSYNIMVKFKKQSNVYQQVGVIKVIKL